MKTLDRAVAFLIRLVLALVRGALRLRCDYFGGHRWEPLRLVRVPGFRPTETFRCRSCGIVGVHQRDARRTVGLARSPGFRRF